MADILGPDGQEYEIDDSELDSALAQGFTVKPPPEQTYAQKAADVVDSARAGIEGLGRGATFGLTDLAQAGAAGLANAVSPDAPARAIGPGIDAPVDQTSDFTRGMRQQKAEIDARAAAHPVAAIGGEVVGAIAPALLTGGAAAAPSLASATVRLTPAAVTSSLAARAAARILPQAAASAAGRIGVAATAGAIENAAQGAARRVVDSLAQGDHEISAERMVGGLGDVVHDAAIGGLAGGLLGGAIEGGQAAYGWAKNKTGQLIEKVAQKPAAEIPKEFRFNLELAQVDPEGAVEAAGPLTSREIGQVADNVQAGVYNDALRAARGAADSFGDTQQGAVRSISKEMTDLAKDLNEIDEGVGLVAKREWAQGLGKGLVEEVPVTPNGEVFYHSTRMPINEWGDSGFGLSVTRNKEASLDYVRAFDSQGELLSMRLPEGLKLADENAIRKAAAELGDSNAGNKHDRVWNLIEGNTSLREKLIADGFDGISIQDKSPNNLAHDTVTLFNPKKTAPKLIGNEAIAYEGEEPVFRTKLPVQTETRLQPTGQLKNAAEASVEKINQYMNQLANIEKFNSAAMADRGGASMVARLRAHIDDYKLNAQKALDEGDLGAFAWQTDRLKSAFQKAAKTRNSFLEPTMVANAEDFRLFLERNDVWGDAWADTQRKVNKAWTNAIRAENDQAVGAFWKRGSEEAVNPFEVLDRPNEQQIGSFLNQLGNAEIEGDEIAVRKYLRAKAMDAQNRAEAWGSPALKDKAQAIAERAKRIEDSFNAVALSKKDKVAWDKVKDSLAMDMAGSIPVAGPAIRKGAKWVGSAVGRMAERAVPVEQAVAEGAEEAVRTMIRGATPRAGAITGASAGEIERAVQQAREMDDPDSPTSSRFRAAIEEVSADDPVFAKAAEAKFKERAAFLNEKAGPAMDDSDPFNPRVPPMPRGEAAKLNRYANAAVAPAAALKRLGRGQGTTEDIETLQTLYPRLYQDFVTRVGNEIKATKKLPTMRQRQALHRATGIPAGRLFTPDMATFLQGEYAHPPPEPVQVQNPNPGAPMDPTGEGAPGRSDAILAGQ